MPWSDNEILGGAACKAIRPVKLYHALLRADSFTTAYQRTNKIGFCMGELISIQTVFK